LLGFYAESQVPTSCVKSIVINFHCEPRASASVQTITHKERKTNWLSGIPEHQRERDATARDLMGLTHLVLWSLAGYVGHITRGPNRIWTCAIALRHRLRYADAKAAYISRHACSERLLGINHAAPLAAQREIRAHSTGFWQKLDASNERPAVMRL
jgi:hypothetical protein